MSEKDRNNAYNMGKDRYKFLKRKNKDKTKKEINRELSNKFCEKRFEGKDRLKLACYRGVLNQSEKK